MKGYERLLELQELDLSIDRLEARRREIESGEEVEEARLRAERAEERVGELRMALDSIGKEEMRLENDVSSLDQRIRAEQGRLYDGSVTNPKELQAIQAEVTNLAARKGRLEDEELDQMERREELEKRLPPLEVEMNEGREAMAELETSSERELAEIARSLADRRAERERLVPEFDEELLELYEDLRAGKRGVGAVALKDGVCQGCHEKLSPLYLDRLKRGEGIRRCEYCRRILVLD
ncbi:MAG: zinc ribbon domain-containing protein [Actinomycetota bacterium]